MYLWVLSGQRFQRCSSLLHSKIHSSPLSGISGKLSVLSNSPIIKIKNEIHGVQRLEYTSARQQYAFSRRYATVNKIDVFTNEDESRIHDWDASCYTDIFLHGPILKDLNQNQIEAVTQPLKSITRVVAGPGSGKTRVLTSRIAYLLQEDRRNNVLAVTFTRKASEEMKTRLEKLLMLSQDQTEQSSVSQDNSIDEVQYPVGLDRVTLGTFHSVCAKILRWNGDYLATLPSIITDMSGSQNQAVLDSKFSIVDQAEQLRILKSCFEEKKIDLKTFPGVKPIDILNRIAECKVAYSKGENPFKKGPRAALSHSAQIALTVYYPYREKLLVSNSIDFDDLIYLTRELLLEHANIRHRLQQRYTHILVDEFQDTSQSQLDLIKLLTSRSLFVVGDADQSIYSWRGAHVGSMSEFEHEFQTFDADGVKTVYLMENYRSTSNIVKAAQQVISNSGKSSGNHNLRQQMIPKRSSGSMPSIHSFADGRCEAEFVVKQVKERVATGAYNKNHSVAIIYRTNAQSRALEESCVIHNVPFALSGRATSFYNRQEVKDCLCYLRWLNNGRDRGSMLRAMVTPKRNIGEAAIIEFDRYCELVERVWNEQAPSNIPPPTPLEVLLQLAGDKSWCKWKEAVFPHPSEILSGRTSKVILAFGLQMQKIYELATTSTVEKVMSAIVDEMKLISHIDKISKSKTEFEERQQNVRELQGAARRYDQHGPCLKLPIHSNKNSDDIELLLSPLDSFLDDVTLVTDMVENTENGSLDDRFVVKLMTIHGSKGMEFDTVFLVGMEDGTLPTSMAINSEKDSVILEEERRLCYVAMTRAKSELIMTWRMEVPIFTSNGIRTMRYKRSRFLDALMPSKTSTSSTSIREAKAESNFSTTSARRSFGSSSNPHLARSPMRSHDQSLVPAPHKVKENTQTRKTFEGTSSVYSKGSTFGKPSYLETKSQPNRSRSPIREFTGSGVPSSVYSKTIQSTMRFSSPRSKTDSQHIPNRTVPRYANYKANDMQQKVKPIKSTWIYPVGSKVFHKSFGTGIVLTPLSDNDVYVQFTNGNRKEIPMNGPELSPIQS